MRECDLDRRAAPVVLLIDRVDEQRPSILQVGDHHHADDAEDQLRARASCPTPSAHEYRYRRCSHASHRTVGRSAVYDRSDDRHTRPPLSPDPDPTNVPERVLRAIARPTIDHRGPEFARLTHEVIDGLRQISPNQRRGRRLSSSGTGAWEAALVNTLSPGDRVLMFETGHFATLWRQHGGAARARRRLRAAATGATASIPTRSRATLARRSRRTRSRPCASCTTRRRPASPAASPTCARRSTARVIPRCCSSTRSRRSRRSTTGTTNGASTSRSAARRRG